MTRMIRKHAVSLIAIAVVFGATMGTHTALAQSAADDPAATAAGMAVFEANCAGCHGADGMGSDRGRPLIDIALSEPDRLVHIASVTDGKGNMPAWGGTLSGEDIDAAVSYVRLTFVTDQPELAVTGASSTQLAVFGILLVLVGSLIFGLLGRQQRHSSRAELPGTQRR